MLKNAEILGTSQLLSRECWSSDLWRFIRELAQACDEGDISRVTRNIWTHIAGGGTALIIQNLKEKSVTLILLRTLNKFVKRLSGCEDKLFRGQIQALVAKIFPISEKSGRQFWEEGLNLKGNFNSEPEVIIESSNQIEEDPTSKPGLKNRPNPDSRFHLPTIPAILDFTNLPC